MKKALKYTSILLGLVFMVLMGCKDDIDPTIEALDFDRVFSPTDLNVNIRNQINAEIVWTLSEDADKYFAEISKDSLLFTSIMMTDTVLPVDLPYLVALEGDETYSVRLTGYSDKGLSPSKTSVFAFKTKSEQILYALPDSMIGKEEVTVSWPADSIVSYYTLNSGGKINFTAAEISAGQVTIVGLTFATEYDFVLFNEGNPKQRGNVTFTTLPEGETLTPDMDLEEKFSNAIEGDKFLLTGGDFTNNYGTISINKSITIKGISSSDMPILHAQFVIGDGVTVTFSKLKLDGDTIVDDVVTTHLDHAFQFNSEATSIGDIIIEGCEVTNYTKSFISGSSGAFSINSITVEECFVYDLNSDGGDFIDFRTSYPAELMIRNTTFANCNNTPRDFLRFDGAAKGNAFDDGINTPKITIEYCTFNNVMNSATSTKRFLYVRWQATDEVIIVKNNIFSDMGVSAHSTQSDTNMPAFSDNNYTNAVNYTDPLQKVYDASGTTLDPGFADAANYDFSLSNQTLIDAEVGDVRWR